MQPAHQRRAQLADALPGRPDEERDQRDQRDDGHGVEQHIAQRLQPGGQGSVLTAQRGKVELLGGLAGRDGLDGALFAVKQAEYRGDQPAQAVPDGALQRAEEHRQRQHRRKAPRQRLIAAHHAPRLPAGVVADGLAVDEQHAEHQIAVERIADLRLGDLAKVDERDEVGQRARDEAGGQQAGVDQLRVRLRPVVPRREDRRHGEQHRQHNVPPAVGQQEDRRGGEHQRGQQADERAALLHKARHRIARRAAQREHADAREGRPPGKIRREEHHADARERQIH